ncbi:hypothetical protein [Methyloferula stellata]|uniref:hypothetical protein n=1 Tax=Methyloferula stellata TaxID=876270 RepID=UPI001268F8A5|nr:hypothetical protein [Methyloferula stellata]
MTFPQQRWLKNLKVRATAVVIVALICPLAAIADEKDAKPDLVIKIEGACFSSPENVGSAPDGAKLVTLQNKNESQPVTANFRIEPLSGSTFYYINNNGNYRTYDIARQKYISLDKGESEVLGCTRNWVSQKIPKAQQYSELNFSLISARYISSINRYKGLSVEHAMEQAVDNVGFLLDYSTACPQGQSGRNVRLVSFNPNRVIQVEVKVNHTSDVAATLYPLNATTLLGCEMNEAGPQNFRVKAAKFLSDPLLQ